MMLDRLIAGLDVRVVRGDAARVRICDLTEDSRTVMPGSLFIARAGLSSDGRRFARDAVEAGASAVLTDDEQIECPRGVAVCVTPQVALASAVLAERFYGEPGSKLAIVGVTGTNGKSTIAHLVHRILNRCGVRCGLIGTIEVDDGREIARASMTTPPAIELSRTLATMVESGCRAVVMEVSSHALDQFRTDGLRFDVAIFTNLTHDHGDYHGSRERYLAAKRRLFGLLREDGVAIANFDDPAAPEIVAPARHVRRCSMGDQADRTGRIVSHDLSGLEVVIEGGVRTRRARLATFGSYNAMNAMQAVLACESVLEKVEPEAAGERLDGAIQDLNPPEGRLELISTPADDVAVFVDYAHSPDALAHVLQAVREAGGKRLCAVIGCGGDRDREKRPKMGRIAAEHADRVIVTSDNPRRESPGAIVAQIVEGIDVRDRGRVDVHVDRSRAIATAILGAVAGEVIVIAGKGHEKEQILPDPADPQRVIARVFDDSKEAAKFLGVRRAQSREASLA